MQLLVRTRVCEIGCSRHIATKQNVAVLDAAKSKKTLQVLIYLAFVTAFETSS
jgi:hypothetical protein